MKLEAEIWEVQEGIVKKIKIGNEIVSIGNSVKQEKEKMNKPIIRSPRNKGKPVGYVNSQFIYENVFNDIVDVYKGEESKDEVKKILKEWHPKVSKSTIKTYYNLYLKHYFNQSESSQRLKERLNKRKVKQKVSNREDTVGYDRVYKKWIKKDDYGLIIRAIRKYDFKATSKEIVNETRLKIHTVNAVLHFMIQKGDVYRTVDKKTGDFIYVPKEGKETKVSFP